MRNFLILLFPLLFVSCATHEEVKKQKRQYSYDVEDDFNSIEMTEAQRKRKAALDRYRRLREEQMKYRKRRAVKAPQKNHARPIVYKDKPKPIIKKKRIIHTDPETMAIEIEQKLTYFCMKNRKSRRFREQGSCQEFTANSLSDCQDKFDIDDRNLLYCVEKRIR